MKFFDWIKFVNKTLKEQRLIQGDGVILAKTPNGTEITATAKSIAHQQGGVQIYKIKTCGSGAIGDKGTGTTCLVWTIDIYGRETQILNDNGSPLIASCKCPCLADGEVINDFNYFLAFKVGNIYIYDVPRWT